MKKALIIFLAGILACKSNSSTRDTLCGKWKLHTLTGERPADSTTGIISSTMDAQNIILTLNADGTGNSNVTLSFKEDTGVANYNFKWSLPANGKYLSFTSDGKMSAFLIARITGSSLVLKDTSIHPAAVETFIKQ